MKVIVLILILIMNSAFAWELKKEGRKVRLFDPANKVNEVVIASTAEPVSVKKLNDDLSLITYFENEAGTKEIVKTYNCAVYSGTKKKIIMKDKLCKTVSPEETVTAEFTITGSKLKYRFEDLELVIQ